jgi:hypothetical protein
MNRPASGSVAPLRARSARLADQVPAHLAQAARWSNAWSASPSMYSTTSRGP